VAPLFVFLELGEICGFVDSVDRFADCVGESHQIRISCHHLYSESSVVCGRSQAVGLNPLGVYALRVRVITVLAEPDCDDSLPEFGDSSGKGAVSCEPLLAQLLVAGKRFSVSSTEALKNVGGR